MMEGDWSYHELSGLEAWFRSPAGPPSRWKMALVTFIGVYPLSLLITVLLSPSLQKLPLAVKVFCTSVLIVVLLTWVIMPWLTRWFRPWLLPASREERERGTN